MSVSLKVDYGIDINNRQCSGVLFEIPTMEVVGGDVLEFRLWGMSHEMLAPYKITQGLTLIGAGVNKTLPTGNVIDRLSFGNSSAAQTEWIISEVFSITAITNILASDGSIWANKNDDVTGKFIWNGNILSTSDDSIISGGVNIEYTSSQDVKESVDFYGTNSYQAEYPIEEIGEVIATTPLLELDEATGILTEYASEGEDIKDKITRSGYSCISLIDNTKLYGTVSLIYKRSPFYKSWNWTVPVGKEGQYWFFIYKDSLVHNKFSIQLPELTSGLPKVRNIVIHVFERGSENIVPNAEVIIGGISYGTTGSDGSLYIDGIMTGTYSLKVLSPDHIPTDEDNLANDEITIY